MNNEIKAWIAIGLGTLTFFADDIFHFLSKGWNDLILIIIGTGFLYLLVKTAVKEALKEHNFDN